MELANKGSHSRISLFSLCKKNKLSNIILMWRQTTVSMVVTEMQHSSLDSPDMQTDRRHRPSFSAETESATYRSQPLIRMPKMYSADFSSWELHTGGQTWTQQNHCLTHLYPQVHYYGKHERCFQYWQHSSGRHDFGKKSRHWQAVSPEESQ